MIYLYEGDNLDVIPKIKVKPNIIYLDPPYGTNNNNLLYNDKTTNQSWFDYFKKRLEAIKRIIDKNAVIYVSIGNNEITNALLALNEIFGKQNLVSIMPRITINVAKTTDLVSNINDFLLIYKIGKVSFKGEKIDTKSYRLKDKYFDKRGYYQLRRLDYNSFKYSPTLDVKINFNKKNYIPGNDKKMFIKRKKEHLEKDWCWLWSKKKISFAIENGFIEEKNGFLYKKTYTKSTIKKIDGEYKVINKERTKPINSLHYTSNKFANVSSKGELEKLFSYPKSNNLIKDLLLRPQFKKKIILDPFAGSGTTGIIANKLGYEAHLIQIPEKINDNHKIAKELKIKNIFNLTKEILKSKNIEQLIIIDSKELKNIN